MALFGLYETKTEKTERLLRGVLTAKIEKLRPLAATNPAAAAEIAEYEARLEGGVLWM